jgi:hypothetical protein
MRGAAARRQVAIRVALLVIFAELDGSSMPAQLPLATAAHARNACTMELHRATSLCAT